MLFSRPGHFVLSAKPALICALVACAMFLAACGGDGDETGSSTTTTSAAETTRQTTSTATTTTATATTSGATTTGAGAVGMSPLQELDSYRYELSMRGNGGPLAGLATAFDPNADPNGEVAMEVTGVYVKPDRGQITITLSGLEIGLTTIGRQQWTAFSGIVSGPQTIPQPAPDDLSFAASFWDEGFLDSTENFSCTGERERVNGIDARKCSIDAETFEQLRQLGGIFSAEESDIQDLSLFSLELWITDTGHPVRMNTEMEGTDTSGNSFALRMSMDVHDINSPNLKVEAPQ